MTTPLSTSPLVPASGVAAVKTGTDPKRAQRARALLTFVTIAFGWTWSLWIVVVLIGDGAAHRRSR